MYPTSFLDYRGFIKNHYDGLPGKLTAVTGILTGHEALAGRLIRKGGFDVRGCKRILDAACGNGRYSKFLLRQADPDAVLTCFDLSGAMLRRARVRLKSGLDWAREHWFSRMHQVFRLGGIIVELRRQEAKHD